MLQHIVFDLGVGCPILKFEHILSKRKPVYSSDIAHSQLQTDAICSKIDIHIKVLTIEVYGNKSA